MGKEVQDVKQIDGDISWGVWDEHGMVWVVFGGLVVVDLQDLVVLVARFLLDFGGEDRVRGGKDEEGGAGCKVD